MAHVGALMASRSASAILKGWMTMASTSYWRKESQRAIARVLERNPGLVDFDILEAIDKAYPFGPRKHLPYKMWLDERKKTMARISTNPILRVCGACGAGIGKACRDMLIGIGSSEFDVNRAVLDDARKSYRTAEEIRALEVMCCHRVRTQHLAKRRDYSEDTGAPLFANTKVAT
jgi:hypothetical protein